MKNSKLSIHYYGHPILREKAKPVEALTEEVLSICKSMVDTMLSMSNCIGFAGPQLGISLRIFVIREEKTLADGSYYFEEPEVIINPVLFSPSKEMETMVEGCMSLPDFHVEVTRPSSICVRYQNLKGEFVEEKLQGFRARMFMHENDHLNGVLIVDRMDPKERKKVDPILKEMKKKYSSALSS
jgi:peptide deformylase